MPPRVFVSHRRRFASRVNNGPVIITGYSPLQRSGDASFLFEQEANFWWLTGIEAPDWQLIIDGAKSYLVAPEVAEIHQIFDGSLSWGEAKRISGVDKVLSIKQADELLKELAARYKTVFTLGPDPSAKYYDFVENPAPMKLYRKLKKQFVEVQDCRLELAKLRAIKQPEEIAAIKKAIDLTISAFEKVKQNVASYNHEYEIEAEFTYDFRRHNATHAYEPIVASGKNACTLHDIQNVSQLTSSDLVLLDIGARVDGYAADITRTYALGTPTARQRQVHKAVNDAHHQIIDLLKPA